LAFDRDLDDFINKFINSPLPDLPGKPKPSSVFHSKSLSALEEYLDLLLQLEAGKPLLARGLLSSTTTQTSTTTSHLY
jgi:hypothetical protein